MTDTEGSRDDAPSPRAGYVTLVGRPNAGKSTLMNALVGQHLSIVTPKAQTTWQRVTGILTTETAQAVFLDTPGLLEARDLFQRSMLGAALEALHEADVVLVVVDAGRGPTAAETEPLERALAETSAPIHVALNKMDAASDESVGAWEAWFDGRARSIQRISALEGHGVAALLQVLVTDLPAHPFFYPEDDVATAPVRFFVAELVRETVFEQYHEEVPYATWCQVEEFREGSDPVYIQVTVFVERTSQKGIIIGSKGRAIRALGEAARAKIEHFLGCHVYLDLWVKPLKSWRKNRGHLGRFGFRIPDDDDDAHRS
ncbi:MAG: GTPase Era [Longimicrobiales bacterium]